MRKREQRRRRAVVEELMRSGPAPPAQYVDDSKIFERLDRFVENPIGLREWLETLASQDAGRAQMALQALKIKYPDLHRILRKQDGGGYDSVTDEILDKELYGVEPLSRQPVEPQRIEVMAPEEAQPVTSAEQKDDRNVQATEESEMPSNETRRRRSMRKRRRNKTYMEDKGTKGRPSMKHKSMERPYMKRKHDKGPETPFDPERARRYVERIPEVSPEEVEPIEEVTEVEEMPGEYGMEPEGGDYGMEPECPEPAAEEIPEVSEEEVEEMEGEYGEEMEGEEMEGEEDEDHDRARRSMELHRSRRRQYSAKKPPAKKAKERRAQDDDIDLDADLDDIPEVGEDEVEVCEPGCRVPYPDEEEGEEMEMEASTKTEADEKTADGEGADEKTAADQSFAAEEDPVGGKVVTREDEKTADGEGAEEETVFEAFLSRAKLESIEEPSVEMILFGRDEEDPHYAVFVQGKPICELRLSDQNIQPEYNELFLRDDYPQVVVEGIRSLGGLTATLDRLNARWYAARATEGEVADAARKSVAADMEAARTKQAAQLKGDLLNVINLVMAASNKNYILQNALKDALVSKMRRAGIDERSSTFLVEEAWREAGADYFSEILTKAEEWLGASPEALEHHKAEIGSAPYRDPLPMLDDRDQVPEARVASAEEDDYEDNVPHSVPIRTVASRQTAQHGDEMRAQVEFWSRDMDLVGKASRKYGGGSE